MISNMYLTDSHLADENNVIDNSVMIRCQQCPTLVMIHYPQYSQETPWRELGKPSSTLKIITSEFVLLDDVIDDVIDDVYSSGTSLLSKPSEVIDSRDSRKISMPRV